MRGGSTLAQNRKRQRQRKPLKPRAQRVLSSRHKQQVPARQDTNENKNEADKVAADKDNNVETSDCVFGLQFYHVNELIGTMRISEHALQDISYEIFVERVIKLLAQQGNIAVARVIEDYKLGKVSMLMVSFLDAEIEIEDMDDVLEQIELTKLENNGNEVAFSLKFVAKGDEKGQEDKAKNVDEAFTVEYFLKKKKKCILRNPFVIVIGIQNYGKTSYATLDGIEWDVYRMAHLWHGIYKYNDISIIFCSNSKDKNSAKNIASNKCIFSKLEQYKQYFNYPLGENDIDLMKNKQTFRDYLLKIRSEIERNERNDGLVLYYSGHGIKDGIKDCIILSNGKPFPIRQIINVFDGEQCVQLRNKPKIMIYDCCRGKKASQTFLNEYEYKNNKEFLESKKMMTTKGDHWYDNMCHVNSGLATIFANFGGYAVNDTCVGGHLTRSIEKIFENPKLIEEESLRDLIVGIRDLTKISAGKGDSSIHWSAQLVDFHETLEYKVYFRPNA